MTMKHPTRLAHLHALENAVLILESLDGPPPDPRPHHFPQELAPEYVSVREARGLTRHPNTLVRRLAQTVIGLHEECARVQAMERRHQEGGRHL